MQRFERKFVYHEDLILTRIASFEPESKARLKMHSFTQKFKISQEDV